MNKSDRTTLAMALRRFNANLTKEIDRFNGIVDTLCAAEGGKIGNLDAPLPLKEGALSPAADFAADCMRRWARSAHRSCRLRRTRRVAS